MADLKSVIQDNPPSCRRVILEVMHVVHVMMLTLVNGKMIIFLHFTYQTGLIIFCLYHLNVKLL